MGDLLVVMCLVLSFKMILNVISVYGWIFENGCENIVCEMSGWLGK